MASKELHGELNLSFQVDSELDMDYLGNRKVPHELRITEDPEKARNGKKRDEWSNKMEFLMSCIAMSVGLGNIWRFPYAAYSNGGGAFLIPYICVLFLVGKPVYFLEMVLGQFSSKGSIKVFDLSPAMRGVGIGQSMATGCVMTYYASIMAIIIYYMFGSFSSQLPWSVCDPEWVDCYASGNVSNNPNETLGLHSSSELYFKNVVLREVPNIDNGIGAPEWKLTLCLLMAWISVFLVLLKGVKSSGKASYFLASFPYVVMIVLLIKVATLPGADNGIYYFLNPDFKKILDPSVWFAAVTQCFFSLTICFGNALMYASYNNFRHGLYRDAMIVTSLDTFTSLLAGITIFGVLGNLAHETGRPVQDVVKNGTALAFVSYPDAISKLQSIPQVFSFLFFFMLYVLGVGSNVGIASCIVTVIRDSFPNMKRWQAISIVVVCGFLISLVYITPGGQWVLVLIDHHGATFIVYLLGICELAAVIYIYGVRRICDDIEFMLGLKVGLYWRVCWVLITPIFLGVIFINILIQLEPLKFENVDYPHGAIVFGWTLTAIGFLQLPFFMILAVYKKKEVYGFFNKIRAAFAPSEEWGPVDPTTKKEWIAFTESKEQQRRDESVFLPRWKKIFNDLFGY